MEKPHLPGGHMLAKSFRRFVEATSALIGRCSMTVADLAGLLIALAFVGLTLMEVSK